MHKSSLNKQQLQLNQMKSKKLHVGNKVLNKSALSTRGFVYDVMVYFSVTHSVNAPNTKQGHFRERSSSNV